MTVAGSEKRLFLHKIKTLYYDIFFSFTSFSSFRVLPLEFTCLCSMVFLLSHSQHVCKFFPILFPCHVSWGIFRTKEGNTKFRRNVATCQPKYMTSYTRGIYWACPLLSVRGSTVVKVLCYKSGGRWLDSRLCHCNFSLTKSFRSHYGPGVDSASNTNEYQEYFLGG